MGPGDFKPNPYQHTDAFQVEVAFAKPERQSIFTVDVPKDATAEKAIEISKICEVFPEIDLEKNPIGIFGKKVSLDTPLRPGDRVEIYRPLKADPKEVRRALAEIGKTMGKKKS